MSEEQQLREDADGFEDDGEGPEELVFKVSKLAGHYMEAGIAVRSNQRWGFIRSYLQEPVRWEFLFENQDCKWRQHDGDKHGVSPKFPSAFTLPRAREDLHHNEDRIKGRGKEEKLERDIPNDRLAVCPYRPRIRI